MIDNLTFTRVWQDVDFFQLEIKCENEFIVATGRIYITDALIDDLNNKIKIFLSGKARTTCWQNGSFGDATTPCVRLQFSNKDTIGHILIEIFMEIDDGGTMSTHNCCFYINTEIGLLHQFMENLKKIKTPQLGIRIALNG